MVPWLVVLDVCVRISLRRLVCRSASLVMLGGVSLPFFCLGPGSKSPYEWVCISEDYDGGFVSLYHVTIGRVCFVVACDSRV
jgi:hypothetical protein